MSLPMLSSQTASYSIGRSTSCFLVPSHVSREDVGIQSIVESISPTGSTVQSIVISSTVKGAQGPAAGKVELIHAFGGYLACTFSDNNRLVIYSLSTQTKQNQSTLPERARAIIVDHACRYIIIASATGRLRIYALATGSLIADVKTHHDRGINVLAVDQQSKWIVAGGEDGVVSVYDFGALISASTSTVARSSTSALQLSISDHSLAITTVQISSSNMLLTASKDGGVRLYQLEQPITAESTSGSSVGLTSAPAPPCLFHYAFRGIVHSAVLDATESIIYVAVKENIHWLSIYNTNHQQQQSAATWLGHSSTILSLALDSSSSHLLSIDGEGVTKVWQGNALYPGSLPPQQGICVKTLQGKRIGGKQIQFVESLADGARNVATQNIFFSQLPVQKGAQVHSTGLQGSTGSWIFPPLNSSAVVPQQSTGNAAAGVNSNSMMYLPVSLVPHNAVNMELSHTSLASTAATSTKRGWFTQAQEELHPNGTCESNHDRDDWLLVTGKSGWSGLTESNAAVGASQAALQNQSETYQLHANELYQLCVEKLWNDVNMQDASSTR